MKALASKILNGVAEALWCICGIVCVVMILGIVWQLVALLLALVMLVFVWYLARAAITQVWSAIRGSRANKS